MDEAWFENHFSIPIRFIGSYLFLLDLLNSNTSVRKRVSSLKTARGISKFQASLN